MPPHFGGNQGSRLTSVIVRGQIPRRTLAFCQNWQFGAAYPGPLGLTSLVENQLPVYDNQRDSGHFLGGLLVYW
jgi:hypothetical protein